VWTPASAAVVLMQKKKISAGIVEKKKSPASAADRFATTSAPGYRGTTSFLSNETVQTGHISPPTCNFFSYKKNRKKLEASRGVCG
jgi:hypothetical protein